MEATDEEHDPVTDWLIAELKEVIRGRPSKSKILAGLRDLLKKASDGEHEER